MLKYLLFLIVILSLISCSDSTAEKEWTILIYMAADNGLNSAAINDIEEMQMAEFSENINVIVQIDHSELNPEQGAFRYHVFPGNKTEISDLGEIDSGDYNTLIEFANWGYNKYPAERNALVIWSHGNGWYNAYNRFCPDSKSLSAISVPDGEFKIALENINHRIDILIMDACNMLTVEVIAEIYQEVDYIVSSEATICPDGFPYDLIFSIWEDYTSVENLASEIVLEFVNSYMPGGSQNPYYEDYEISCAVAKTADFNKLLEEIEGFSINWLTQASSTVFQTSRQECIVEFNDLYSDIDIMDYFTKLRSNSTSDSLNADCTSILEVIDEIFIAQFYIDLEDPNNQYPAGTATIWFPDSQQTFSDLCLEYMKLDFAETGWTNFLWYSFVE